MLIDARARRILLGAARWCIERKLGRQSGSFVNPDAGPVLDEPRASFVTLRCRGELCGCIGTLEIERPLLQDVMHNARAAAFHDPRFPPLDGAALDHLEIEISVLSAIRPLVVGDRTALLRALRPGTDGVVLEEAGQRATFLPSVWSTLPEPAAFMDALLEKAGLPAGHWSARLRIFHYQTDSFHEDRTP
ncbi:MAG: AmmeMemoRadiSam system protein A [Gammaproteobacteria bacterium]